MKPGRRQGAAPPAPERLLTQAVDLHRTGRLAEAEDLYRGVLKTRPRHADALHLLGVLTLQLGRPADALALIGRAIAENGAVADYHDNLGSALAAAGRSEEAAAAHRQALRLRPDFAAARFNLGNALQAQGRAADAAACLAGALALRPDYGKAWYNLGNAMRDSGHVAAAASALQRAVTLLPGMAEAHNNLGEALAALGRLDEAIAHHRTVTRLRPDDATAFYNLGAALQQRSAHEEAEIAYREALKRRPSHVAALNNLGSVLRRLNRPDQAELCHREALRHRPDFIEALYNLGNAIQAQGRLTEAAACYEEALARMPDLATASYNLALLALDRGDLVHGWQGYERRFAAGEARPDRRPPLPRWHGEKLAGRRLLVWREQGIGDEFLFASCLPDLLARADGPVLIETEPRLTSLFARSFPAATVRAESCTKDAAESGPLPADLHLPAGSLPQVLRPGLAAFPGTTGWLVPDPERVAVWQKRLAAIGPGPRIGISWRSQLVTDERRAAYTTLADWAAVLALPGIHLVTLQYGEVEEELRAAERRFGVTLHRWAGHDLKDDFEETAALVASLDLVITVATAVGELAGALGVPVWRFGGPHDWSALGTACRPWFPTMRLFQPRPGEDLRDVLGRIARSLPPAPALPAALPRAASDPAAAEAAFERGLQAHRGGRAAEAEAAYRAALDAYPQHVDALHLLGLILHQSGRSGEAVALIGAALALDPEFPQAHNNLGLVLQALGRSAAAERRFAAAVALHPGYADALDHLGVLRQNRREPEGALVWHRRARRLDPGNAKFHTNLGAALDRAGRFQAAEEAHRRAAALTPDQPKPLNDLGMVARTLGRAGEMNTWLDRALRSDPGFALAAWNRGLLDLAKGNLAAGWAGYAARFRAGPPLRPARPLPMPDWQGEPLAGRRLLVWNEQGVGDEILFASAFDRLEGAGGPVVLECDRRLVPLFARAFPWAEVRAETHAAADAAAVADLAAPAGTVAACARGTLPAFPPRPAVLTAEPVRAALWRERVAALAPGLRIGIAWRSQLMDAHRALSYTRIEEWGPLLRLPGVVAVNLQYGDCEAELAAVERQFGITVHRWPDLDLKDDFESTAALVAALDLVIVPATAVGELAGALGVPVWRLGSADWTWLGTAVRPWFPGMRTWAPRGGESLGDVLGRMARHLTLLQATAPVSA